MEGSKKITGNVYKKTVNDNGLNPIWWELFVFDIRMPEFAILTFTVHDNDIKEDDDFLAWNAVKISCMQVTYRFVPL